MRVERSPSQSSGAVPGRDWGVVTPPCGGSASRAAAIQAIDLITSDPGPSSNLKGKRAGLFPAPPLSWPETLSRQKGHHECGNLYRVQDTAGGNFDFMRLGKQHR